MVTCGHQFHMGDECDWLICSSAVCPVNGNTSATKILKRLIEAHCNTRTDESETFFSEVREIKNDTNKLDLSFHLESGNSDTEAAEESNPKMPEFILEAREMPLETPHQRKSRGESRTGSGYCTSEYCDEEESDENQHVDGCPIKWYYRKRTKSGWGPCIALRRNAEATLKRSNVNGVRFRDRIPLEVKIGKISLNKREPLSDFRSTNRLRKHQTEPEKYRKFEIDPKVAELQKKRLEAKLNWRPFRENEDEESSQISYDLSSGDGYLRPRSALGGKAPVSILLFPYHQKNCTCGWGNIREVPKIRIERVSPPKIANPPKPSEAQGPNNKPSRAKTLQITRRATKNQRRGKRLQMPKQMNVLFDAPKKRLGKLSVGPLECKKTSEKTAMSRKTLNEERMRNARSLTSLYYQLEDKSNSGRVVDDEYLEKMIRELSMEDNLRGFRGILTPGFSIKKKRCNQETHMQEYQWSNEDSFKIICRPVKLSQRRPKSRILSESVQASATTAKETS